MPDKQDALSYGERPMKRALLLTLLLGALLRVVALDFGLDREDASRAILHHQQDEEGMTDAVWRGLLHGDWNPGPFMLWGSAGYYLFGLADAAVFWPRSWVHPAGWQGVLTTSGAIPPICTWCNAACRCSPA